MFVQVVNGIIEKVTAVCTFFHLHYTAQVYFYKAHGPQPGDQYAFIHHPDAVIQEKPHDDGYKDNTEARYGQDVGFVIRVRKKIKGIGRKAKHSQYQPDSHRHPFPAQVLLFYKDRFLAHNFLKYAFRLPLRRGALACVLIGVGLIALLTHPYPSREGNRTVFAFSLNLIQFEDSNFFSFRAHLIPVIRAIAAYPDNVAIAVYQ